MPDEVKVYDLLNVLVLFAASVGITTGAVSIMVPPPFMAVATCMKLLKEVLVLPEPMLLTVELKVLAVPTVAVVGETAPAVRSGIGGRNVQLLLF